MFFSPKKLLIGAAAFLLAGSAAAQSDCDSGPWQDVSSVGGQGGGAFCATKWKQGVVVTGVEVWASGKGVLGIEFFYSDGSDSELRGKIDGDKHDRMDWDPATDGISQIRLWGNGRGQHLGRVHIRTKSGKELDVGKDTNGQDTFETNVGSGIMLGAFGKSGDLVDSLGFLFLKSKISKVSIDDIVFEETPEQLNERQKGLETVVLEYADHTNDHDNATETFTFGKVESRTTSKTVSSTASNTFGWSHALELSGKILDLGASSTTTLKYEYSKSNTESSSKESTVSLNYAVATVLLPGHRVYCMATAMSGVYNGKFTGQVNIWLEDGGNFSFQQGGTLDQVNWSKASSKCQATPFDPATKRGLKYFEEKRAMKFNA